MGVYDGSITTSRGHIRGKALLCDIA
jgi:hypothetical protein